MVSPGLECFSGELKPIRGMLSSSCLALPANNKCIATGIFSYFRGAMLEFSMETLLLLFIYFLISFCVLLTLGCTTDWSVSLQLKIELEQYGLFRGVIEISMFSSTL